MYNYSGSKVTYVFFLDTILKYIVIRERGAAAHQKCILDKQIYL